MSEKLYAYAILYCVGFDMYLEYNKYLDFEFLRNPNDKLLLKLEEHSSSKNKTSEIIDTKCRYISEFDEKAFGFELIKELRRLYEQYSTNIDEYALKLYDIWNLLPNALIDVEPFEIMCYVSDPLSYGDKQQTINFLNKIFNYYT